MSRLDFLRAALPPGTRYSLRLIKKAVDGHDVVRNKLYGSLEELDHDIDGYLEAKWNVYYSTAGFGAANSAAIDNAVAKQEFYVDVDCGDNKPYADKVAGLVALRTFTKTIGLPKPTIIDSGNGIHAHWILNAAVPVHDWKAVAEALKERCKEYAFSADAVCTADAVRVLRIPETVNFKGGNAVQLLTPIVSYSFDTIKAAVGVAQGDIFTKAKEVTKGANTNEVLKFIDKNKISKFQTIWEKSIGGSGCAQIRFAIKNSEELPEPLWRGALSIAQFCEDRDWAIHEISKDHPNYSPEETERKASLVQGPYTCETFSNLGHPELCEGCPHKDKIKSPIQLGTEIKKAESEDSELYVKQNDVEIKYEIPSYPWPFFRGKNGGIYARVSHVDNDGKKEIKEEMVYCHDLYAFDRQRHGDFGDIVWMRHHLPHDGVREFMLAQTDIGAKDRLRDAVSKEGVTVFTTKQLGFLQDFLAKQIEDLQNKAKAASMHTRFGWTTYGTFIVGTREYTAQGVKHAPIASVVAEFAQWFEPKGTLEQWKKVAAAYEDETYDMHAAGVLAGFGSVLMHISPENGGVINYYSKASGTGKTTILKLANSIYGDPRALMKDARDTKLSKVHRMGLLNGIVCCIDEMTNLSPEELSELTYGSTQGRGRDRMQSGINAERVNRTTWKLISLWSSNASVESRLGIHKADPQGELARLLEIPLRTPVPSDVLEAQKLFTSLNDNYGHAGDMFLNYVVPNMKDVITLWNGVRDKVYSMRKWTQTERYKLNQIICIGAAGAITNSLGLTNYNIKRIIGKLVALVYTVAEELRANATSAVETISTYLNQNINNTLVINGVARKGTGGLQEVPTQEPRGPLRIRYEPDQGTLYIVQRDFDKWCAESFINAKELRNIFRQETNRALPTIKKRMMKGWRVDAGPVSVYVIENASTVLNMGVLGEDSADNTGDDQH